MEDQNDSAPGLSQLIRRAAATGLGALQSRSELLLVEWQLERARLTELFILSLGLGFLGLLAAVLFTAIIIFLFPDHLRLYVAGAFGLLYLSGALFAMLAVRSRMKQEPFSETVDQLKRDREWLDSFR
jgi:uncharacterized membrane protein YqjE